MFVVEVITIPCGGISGQQLFEYMRNHDKGYGMRTIYMASSVFDTTPETQVCIVHAVCIDGHLNRTLLSNVEFGMKSGF